MTECIFSQYDSRVNVYGSSTNRLHAVQCGRTSCQERSEHRRLNKAEPFYCAELSLMKRRHRRSVINTLGETWDIPVVSFAIRVTEHRKSRLNRRGAKVRARLNALGNLHCLVRIKRPSNSAEFIQRRGGIDPCAGGAICISNTRSATCLSISHLLSDGSYSLAGQFLHRGRNIIFIHQRGFAGILEQNRILYERHGNVREVDPHCIRSGAFRRREVGGVNAGNLSCGCIDGLEPTKDYGVSFVQRLLVHLTEHTKNNLVLGVFQHFALCAVQIAASYSTISLNCHCNSPLS